LSFTPVLTVDTGGAEGLGVADAVAVGTDDGVPSPTVKTYMTMKLIGEYKVNYISYLTRSSRTSNPIKKTIDRGETNRIVAILGLEGKCGLPAFEREQLRVGDCSRTVCTATTGEENDLVTSSASRIEIEATVSLERKSQNCGK